MRYNLLLKKIGGNVRRIRIHRKINQYNLAESCFIYQNRISNIENGKGNPSLKILNDIANALDVEITELFN